MKNASFYVLAILVFGLIGSPISNQVLNYKFDNLNVLGVNAYAESDGEDTHGSQNNDNEQESEQGDQSGSEDQSSSEDSTDNQSEDNVDDQSENATNNEPEDNSNDQSEDNSDNQSENATNNEPEDNSDGQSHDNTDSKQQKSEAKTEQLISKLEQKITQLEQRIQSLLEKVQNGQYFGNLENTDPVTKSYTISFDGTATSIQDNSVSASVSADIFAENLVTKDGYSKLKVTGGQIDVGQTTYDIVFGKARVIDNQSGQGSLILLVAEVMDGDGNIATMRINLDSAQSFQATDTQPMDLQIGSPQSKIAGQWFLEGTGSLSS